MAALKTVLELKLQLKSSESKTVLKTLKKLQELDITIDILAETGIGKLVNSFRKHNEAGEVARTLVTQWKKLIPKENPSKGKDKDSEKKSSKVEAKAKTFEPEQIKQPEQQNEGTESNIQNSEVRTSDKPEAQKNTVPNQNTEAEGNCVKDLMNSESSKGTTSNETKLSTSDPEMQSDGNHSKGGIRTEKEPNDSKGGAIDSKKNNSNAKETKPKHKRDKTKKTAEKVVEKKIKIKTNENIEDPETQGMSFEAFLSYDLVVPKRKRSSDVKKKPSKRPKIAKSEDLFKTPSIKLHTEFTQQPPQMGMSKNEILDLLNVPLPLTLPKCDDLSNYHYFEEKTMVADTEVDREEASVFTGQRLKKKMQVYSGSKSSSLPAMMSLYQQCIRALQNNIDSLYEVGGVPFEILEPVLERCTPEQLIRIEECNPVYIGLTDHLWEKHCQRDFRGAQLQEYESWREMFSRLSEERERKLASLTKSIVSAHSQRPKGRQVKMAFIHCAAKPPRNVRVQQEIHGTAGPAMQPHPLDRPRVQCQESKLKPVCREYPRPGTNITGPSQAQDPRKIKRVAPMMAKSLKAFKEQRRRR